jgi:hypothetical protein
MGLDFRHLKGDTFDIVNFEVKINDQPVNLTGATIKMQLRKDAYDHVTPPTLSFTSVANNGITITQPLLGKFNINQQIIDIDVFKYFYDIQITFPTGVVKTYINGFFDVLIDVTI